MKTDDLVGLLAADTLPVRQGASPRRLALAMVAGLPLAAAFMLLKFGLREDIGQAVSLPMFWVKLLFPAVLSAAAWAVLQRIARPGVRLGGSWLGIVVPVVVFWALAGVSLVSAPAELRASLVMGHTWRTCSATIALLSLPLFVAVFMALATLAPTRPAWAGACAGAMAGGAGAAVYALHCPELEAPFLAVWYVLGMAIPVVAGALIGPRLLRW